MGGASTLGDEGEGAGVGVGVDARRGGGVALELGVEEVGDQHARPCRTDGSVVNGPRCDRPTTFTSHFGRVAPSKIVWLAPNGFTSSASPWIASNGGDVGREPVTGEERLGTRQDHGGADARVGVLGVVRDARRGDPAVGMADDTDRAWRDPVAQLVGTGAVRRGASVMTNETSVACATGSRDRITRDRGARQREVGRDDHESRARDLLFEGRVRRRRHRVPGREDDQRERAAPRAG